VGRGASLNKACSLKVDFVVGRDKFWDEIADVTGSDTIVAGSVEVDLCLDVLYLVLSCFQVFGTLKRVLAVFIALSWLWAASEMRSFAF
jgi:hypothetical protein